MADKELTADERRQKAHDDELAAQERVKQAVHDATHDAKGNPIPILPPPPLVPGN